MKQASLALVIMLIAGCATPQPVLVRTPCPPLPEIAKDTDKQLYLLTIIALYGQCAKGQQ